jgi:hypothetical protein
VAIETLHQRYVTALGADQGWILKAETTKIEAFEEFEIVPLGLAKMAKLCDTVPR